MRFIKKSEGFFEKPVPQDVRDPYLYHLRETADFICEWIARNPAGNVTVVGDYDTDGICSTAILYWLLAKMGVKPVLRLPHRFSEGYGLSEKIVDEIPDGLLITIDNGIAALPAMRKAKEKGLTVVVIDHHLPPVDENGNVMLPCADVLLDPHVEPEKSEFVDYCGAGLAYRLAKAVYPDMKFKPLLVLASLGTVADVMPLTEANRTLVKDGLAAINRRVVVPGLQVLLDKLQLDNHINEEDYGFKLGPIFNASGRLKDAGAEDVLRLMTSKRGDVRGPYRADALIETNEERKEKVKRGMDIIHSLADKSRPSVLYDPSFHEGIVGILAGKVSEERNCPVIVFTDAEEPGYLKGSGRSIPDIHLKNVLDQIQLSCGLIDHYGGHAGAAGLTIRKENLEAFTKVFREDCGEMPPEENDVIFYDEELNVGCLEKTMEQILRYAPYGEGNPKPLFHLVYTPNASMTRMGDGTHFQIRDDRLTLVGFGMADEYEDLGSPQTLDCVGYLSENWYKGKKSFRFEITAMKAA